MDPELLWSVLAAVLVIAEVLTVTLVLGFLGVGALAAALAAVLGLPVVVQALAFAGSSTALLLLVRPPVKRALDRSGTSERTDPRALTGSTAVVTQRVSDDTGQVRLNGELWRARPYAGGADVPAGSTVVVAQVEGATLHVYPEELS